MNSIASTRGARLLLLLLFFFVSSLTTTKLSAQVRVDNYIQEAATKNFEYVFDTYLGAGDDVIRSLVMPFAFTYDGTEYATGTRLYISHNGWVKLGSSSSGYNVVGNSSYPGIIAAFAADQYSSIYYGVSGSSPNRVLTVMFYSLRSYYTPYNYQYINVRLFEGSNAIEFNYQTLNKYHNTRPSGVGLNGNTSGGFRSNVFSTSLYYTPSQNIRYRPPVSDKPALTVSGENFIDFGQLELGATQTACITVTNTGTPGEAGAPANPLVFQPAILAGANDYTIASEPAASLEIGESADYCVTFAPLTPGPLNATLQIKTNAETDGDKTFNLVGVGLAPVMTIDQEFLFRKTHTKAGFELEQSFPIENTGNAPLTITSITLAGEYPDQYEIMSIPDAPIAPGTEGWVTVMHKPFMEGLTDAELHITSDGFSSGTYKIDLWGTGIIPRLGISTSMTGIDSVHIGDTTYYNVRLENVGSDTLLIGQDYFSSADPDFFYAGLYGADSIILPGQVREVTVGFAPQSRGVRQARLRLTTNIPLTFEATPRDTSEFNVDFTHVGVPSGLLYAETTIADTSLVGSAVCNPITIFNNGLEALTVTSLNVSGVNAGDFTINGITLPVTIAAMSSINGEICVTPSDRGERSAEITINATSNEQDYSQVLPVTVLGQLACASPDMTSAFEGEIVRVSTSQNATITVTNCGDVPTVYTATVAGEGYALVSAPMSDAIAPGATHTYEVSFTPTSMSAMPGTLTIAGDNVDDIVVNLAGTGGTAVLAATNTNAGSIAVGSSIDFDVSVENTGNLDWTGIDATVDGGDFVVKNAPTTVAANSSGTFTFTFTPSVEGARTAMVSFPGSDAATFSFALSGEGIVADVHPAAVGGYALGQNYPNPFISSSSIRFSLAKAGYATLVVSDVTGRVVATLAEGFYPQGESTIEFSLPELPAGNYFYELRAGEQQLQRAMVVRK